MNETSPLSPETWAELAALIEQLPPERQTVARQALRHWSHDLRSALGVIYSATRLLQRHQTQETLELHDAIRSATAQALALQSQVSQALEKAKG